MEVDGGFALSVARELARQLQASGGFALPETRPSVFTIVAAGAGSRPQASPASCERALERWGNGRRRSTAAGSRRTDFAASARARPRRSSRTSLLVDGPERAWGGFCRRQCDRLLVVASGEPPDERADPTLAGCELVLDGVPAGGVGRWLDAVSTARAPRRSLPGAAFAAGVGRVARRLTQRSLGVVLSGGGARGFAHIGALAALADAGFEFDRIGGCSMGAFIARDGRASAGPRTRSRRAARRSSSAARRSTTTRFPRVSLIRSRKAAAMLERVFGDALVEELDAAALHGQRRPADEPRRRPPARAGHRRGRREHVDPGHRAARAGRRARLLVDGGVLNNLPIDHMAEVGEGPIVAVDVIRRMEATGARSRRCRRSPRRSPARPCSARSSARSATARSRCSS